MNEKCRGCANPPNCSYMEVNKRYVKCPCPNCILLVMCSTTCLDWIKFSNKSDQVTTFKDNVADRVCVNYSLSFPNMLILFIIEVLTPFFYLYAYLSEKINPKRKEKQ